MKTEDKYNLIQKIEEQAPGYRAELPGSAWSRIESRLESQKQGKKISFYKSIYSAAIVLIVIASISIISLYFGSNNQNLFSKEKNYSQYTIEELDVEEYTYPVYDVHSLLASYQLLFDKGNSFYQKDIEEIKAAMIN